ncbi:MAG: hypothetical protein ACYT04_45410 [Nostoc sp.]
MPTAGGYAIALFDFRYSSSLLLCHKRSLLKCTTFPLRIWRMSAIPSLRDATRTVSFSTRRSANANAEEC